MIEVQECDEVSLAFAEFVGDSSIMPNNLIGVRDATLFTQAEALEARITKQVVNALDGWGGANN